MNIHPSKTCFVRKFLSSSQDSIYETNMFQCFCCNTLFRKFYELINHILESGFIGHTHYQLEEHIYRLLDEEIILSNEIEFVIAQHGRPDQEMIDRHLEIRISIIDRLISNYQETESSN